jgi:hypothetical protein
MLLFLQNKKDLHSPNAIKDKEGKQIEPSPDAAEKGREAIRLINEYRASKGEPPLIYNKYPEDSTPKLKPLGEAKQEKISLKNGLIVDEKGIIYSSPGNEVQDFVVTKDSKLHIGYKHQHLSEGNEPVLAAGGIKIKNGQIVSVDNNTGHYRPTEQEFKGYQYLFDKMNIDTKKTKFTYNKF